MSIENPCPMGGASIAEYEYNMRRQNEERIRMADYSAKIEAMQAAAEDVARKQRKLYCKIQRWLDVVNKQS